MPSDGKESAYNAGNLDSIPGLGRSPGRGHGNPLQCSCLDSPHGQRSLEGCSPWGCKELDVTESLRPAQTCLQQNSAHYLWYISQYAFSSWNILSHSHFLEKRLQSFEHTHTASCFLSIPVSLQGCQMLPFRQFIQNLREPIINFLIPCSNWAEF